MNANAENYEDSTGRVAAGESNEREPSPQSSKHSDPIGRSLDLLRTWIKKCTDIASDGKPLVFTITFLASSILVGANFILFEFDRLMTVANEIANFRLGPERSALGQTLGPPTPKQIENDSALISLIRSSVTQGLSSYQRIKGKQNPFISRTTNSRRLPLIAKAQPTQLPPGTFKPGVPMGFNRDSTGHLRAFELPSSRTIPSFLAKGPAGRR